MWTLLNLRLLTALLTASHAVSQPSVQLGGTTLIGSSLQSANLEFFGGSNLSHIFDPISSSHLTLRHPLCRASSR